MTDDLSKRAKADAIRVNVHEPSEVERWTKKWKVTEPQLIEAVQSVGVMVRGVGPYLRRKGYAK